MRLRRRVRCTPAASVHSRICAHARRAGSTQPGSSASMPDTTWKSMSQRLNAQLISGTQQAQRLASHSLVSVRA